MFSSFYNLYFILIIVISLLINSTMVSALRNAKEMHCRYAPPPLHCIGEGRGGCVSDLRIREEECQGKNKGREGK